MKKNVIAVLLSVVLAAGSIGTIPVLAAETTAEEAVVVEDNSTEPEEAEEIEEAELELTDSNISEGDAVQLEEAYVQGDEETIEQDDIAKGQDESVDATETDENEAVSAVSGKCGADATWKITGTGNDLTLTISGSGAMDDFDPPNSRISFYISPWDEYSKEIKTVIVEEGITTIGNNAFYIYENISKVVFPDSLTAIGDYAFYNVYGITSLEIPAGVTQFGKGAFACCLNLQNIVIPNGVTKLDSTFLECGSLKSINIPDSVTSIGPETFYYCTGLTSITIPDSVISIGDLAFSECDSLESIFFPAGNDDLSITYYAFYSDNGMQADVYTMKGSPADAYFTKLGKDDKHTFNIYYPCDPAGPKCGNWIIKASPTCKDTGIKERRCIICGEKETEVVPVSNSHTWNTQYTVDLEPTYNAEVSESIHCSVCNTIKPGSARTVPKTMRPLNLVTVSGIENRVHNGEEQTLDLVVIDGDNVLTKGSDYTVSYENNINVGIATVTVTGISNYTGTISENFPILPAASSKVKCTNVASGIKVSWNKVDGATSYFVYRDDKFLFRTSALEVTDKEVKYNTGTKYTYRVIASAKDVGNSTKARTAKMFRLMPVGIKSLTNPSAGKMTVSYDKCKGCYGYVVRYGLKSDMSDANVVTVKGDNTLSRTFSGMKKGKTYYVQVRTYMLEYGVRYYSGYCTTKTIKISK